MRLLLIGPSLRVIGGTTVMFADMLTYLRGHSRFPVSLIYSNLTRSRALNFILVAARLPLAARTADVVMLNASQGGVLVLGILVRLVAGLMRKSYAVRIFGGGFDVYYTGSSVLKRYLLRRVLTGSSLVLVETRHLVRFLQSGSAGRGISADWFPNTRSMMPVANASTSATKFYFAGHINAAKGVRTLLEAARLVRHDLTIYFFGTPQDADLPDRIRETARCVYVGEVPPQELLEHARGMDALVFPTRYSGEGYAGAVIEATLLGKPVIATRWRAIPEIVAENGLLVDVDDAVGLAAAMDRLHEDPELYRLKSEAAHALADRFRSDVWLDRLIHEYLPAIASGAGEVPRNG
jgi:glycosyltransferase involved in cell wall biosynthesis